MTVKFVYGMSPQSRSGGGGGMQTVGYEESHPPPPPPEVDAFTATPAQSLRELPAGSQAVTQNEYEPAACGVNDTVWTRSKNAVPIPFDHDLTKLPDRRTVMCSLVRCVLSPVW
jgi:hypothetical protein